MKIGKMSVVLLLLSGGVAAVAQEDVRQIEGTGRFDKYLTPGLLDRWIIEGEKGETVIAHVLTKQFDPILELAVPGEKEDKILFTVDDKGSESRFSIRLPETGKYSIRVHAFKYKGGGNYSLQIRRFHAAPLTIGKTVVGTIDREGKDHRWFEAKRDQVVTIGLRGTSSRSWELFDGKGRRIDHWAGAAAIDEDGVHSARRFR